MFTWVCIFSLKDWIANTWNLLMHRYLCVAITFYFSFGYVFIFMIPWTANTERGVYQVEKKKETDEEKKKRRVKERLAGRQT